MAKWLSTKETLIEVGDVLVALEFLDGRAVEAVVIQDEARLKIVGTIGGSLQVFIEDVPRDIAATKEVWVVSWIVKGCAASQEFPTEAEARSTYEHLRADRMENVRIEPISKT